MITNSINKWTAGKISEINFWSNWFKDNGGKWQEDYHQRLDFQRPLQKYIEALLPPANDSEAIILDVGAGPITFLGYQSQGRKLKIVPLDPLGEQYEQMWKSAGLQLPFPTIACEGEKLLEIVPENSCDLAYSRNALDHAYDPLTIIMNMVKAVRPHCYALIEVYENEGEKEKYHGFHQWNFQIKNDGLYLWNRDNNFLISPEIEKIGQLNVSQTGRAIKIKIKKNS